MVMPDNLHSRPSGTVEEGPKKVTKNAALDAHSLQYSQTHSECLFDVEVVYALPDRQTVLCLQVASGTTLEQAITVSGLLLCHPEIDLTVQKTGIFGQLKPLNTLLYPNDRIEIYRPLLLDPKAARRQRVKEGRSKENAKR